MQYLRRKGELMKTNTAKLVKLLGPDDRDGRSANGRKPQRAATVEKLQCTYCGEFKAPDRFRRESRNKALCNSHCLDCERVRKRMSYLRHRDKVIGPGRDHLELIEIMEREHCF